MHRTGALRACLAIISGCQHRPTLMTLSHLQKMDNSSFYLEDVVSRLAPCVGYRTRGNLGRIRLCALRRAYYWQSFHGKLLGWPHEPLQLSNKIGGMWSRKNLRWRKSSYRWKRKNHLTLEKERRKEVFFSTIYVELLSFHYKYWKSQRLGWLFDIL